MSATKALSHPLTFRTLQFIQFLVGQVGFQTLPNEDGLRVVSRSSGTPPAPVEPLAKVVSPRSLEDLQGYQKMSLLQMNNPQKYNLETTDWATVDQENGDPTPEQAATTPLPGYIPVIWISQFGRQGTIFTAAELYPYLLDNVKLMTHIALVLGGTKIQEWRQGK